MPKHSDLEHKALQFIANTGDEGVLQSNLWRQLNASSREGSRIALKLEGKGLVRRERELFGGRWTYRLYPKRKPASINSIIDCPCLTCVVSIRCGAYGATSPNDCDKLTEWIDILAQEAGELKGDS
ncbi:transcriptional regulator [Candidatus Bathyarchaeota archaeon]|nr:transcriptional regulator [Candidatus Bathyarchaeota archaeon]